MWSACGAYKIVKRRAIARPESTPRRVERNARKNNIHAIEVAKVVMAVKCVCEIAAVRVVPNHIYDEIATRL